MSILLVCAIETSGFVLAAAAPSRSRLSSKRDFITTGPLYSADFFDPWPPAPCSSALPIEQQTRNLFTSEPLYRR
jgi:hypothetical protein